MSILEKAFLWILYSSLTSIIIILVVLLIKKIFKDQLSPRLCHALWFLVLIKLLIPFVPESNLSLFNLFPEKNINPVSYNSFEPKYLTQEQWGKNDNEFNLHLKNREQDEIDENTLLKDNLPKSDNQKLLSRKESKLFQRIISICSYIWLIGFLSICILIFIVTLNFKKKTRLFNEVKNLEVIKVLNVCKEKLNVNKNIPIYSSDTFKTPFIYGFLNPTIYLPKHILNKVDNSQLLHICLHEIAHYKRKDLFYNLLGTVAIVIHWFNPMVWLAMKEMRVDRELACDSYVLEVLGENESIPYGMTIIKLSQIISNQRYQNILSVHFYKNKTQIERRITMIKMFKKGSYKISIIAVALFIVLGTATLTNAKSLKGENKDKISSKDLMVKEKKEFVIESPSKFFNNLDRAKDFVDFEFKVPDFIPVGYEFFRVLLDENNIISVDFEKNAGTPFNFMISKKDIMKEIKESYSEINKSQIHTIDFKEEPMTVGNINGNSLTIDRKYKDRNTERLHDVATTGKYFIWEDESIWYSIQYSDDGTRSDSSSYKNEISKDDLQKIVSSIKYPADIKNISYISKPFQNLLLIYNNKDLNAAEKMLSFKPKFPLSLPIGFYPTESKVSTFYYGEELKDRTGDLKPSIIMNTTFSPKGESSNISKIEFAQTKNTFLYNKLEKDAYFKTKDYNINKVKEIKVDAKVEVNTLEIDNTKVYTYEEELDASLNSSLKKSIKKQIYVWQQEDIVYKAEFVYPATLIKEIDKEHETVKILINEPKYVD